MPTLAAVTRNSRAAAAAIILCPPSSSFFCRERSAAVTGEVALEDDALDGGDDPAARDADTGDAAPITCSCSGSTSMFAGPFTSSRNQPNRPCRSTGKRQVWPAPPRGKRRSCQHRCRCHKCRGNSATPGRGNRPYRPGRAADRCQRSQAASFRVAATCRPRSRRSPPIAATPSPSPTLPPTHRQWRRRRERREIADRRQEFWPVWTLMTRPSSSMSAQPAGLQDWRP